MRTRYRLKSRLFRKPLVVLQIGEMRPYNYDPAYDFAPGGFSEVWRDATAEDIINSEPEQ